MTLRLHAGESAASADDAKGGGRAESPTLDPARLVARERMGRMLARSIVAARSSHRAVAKALGCSPQYVDRMCAGGAAIREWSLLRLPPKVLAQFAEQLAAVADEALPAAVPWHHHAALLSKELGEAVNAHLTSAAPEEAEREVADVVRAGQAWLRARRES